MGGTTGGPENGHWILITTGPGPRNRLDSVPFVIYIDRAGGSGLELCWGKQRDAKKFKAEPLLSVVAGFSSLPTAAEIFAKADADNSGYVDSAELPELYKRVRGEKLSKKRLAAALAEMDADNSGAIELREFEQWWAVNGGDLEQQRGRALTVQCGGGPEPLQLLLVGAEAGGHLNRGTIGLMALLPAIMDHADGRPVLAAGGITTREDVRAAMSLGAAGVLVGTAFVASAESEAHPLYKRKIVEATTDDTEYRTGYSFGWRYGTPHRVIPNRDRWNLLRFVGGGARAIDAPRMARKLSLYAGQGAGHIHDVLPAADRMAELIRGLPAGTAG